MRAEDTLTIIAGLVIAIALAHFFLYCLFAPEDEDDDWSGWHE